jgi:hypothetical protein
LADQKYFQSLHYCKKELAQIGIENETSFKTALETYLEKKFDVKPDPINPVYSEFGLGMEDLTKKTRILLQLVQKIL